MVPIQEKPTLRKNRIYTMIKIGFTQCSTDSAEKNRMKQIKYEFNADNDKSVAVIFVLMKRAVDTTSHHEFEER